MSKSKLFLLIEQARKDCGITTKLSEGFEQEDASAGLGDDVGGAEKACPAGDKGCPILGKIREAIESGDEDTFVTFEAIDTEELRENNYEELADKIEQIVNLVYDVFEDVGIDLNDTEDDGDRFQGEVGATDDRGADSSQGEF